MVDAVLDADGPAVRPIALAFRRLQQDGIVDPKARGQKDRHKAGVADMIVGAAAGIVTGILTISGKAEGGEGGEKGNLHG